MLFFLFFKLFPPPCFSPPPPPCSVHALHWVPQSLGARLAEGVGHPSFPPTAPPPPEPVGEKKKQHLNNFGFMGGEKEKREKWRGKASQPTRQPQGVGYTAPCSWKRHWGETKPAPTSNTSSPGCMGAQGCVLLAELWAEPGV